MSQFPPQNIETYGRSMRIYGLDFTSTPSKRKRLTLARCELDNGRLVVQALNDLNTQTDGDFSRVSEFLAGSGDYGTDWVAGIDFPFGLPAAATVHFGWLTEAAEHQGWTTWINAMYAGNATLSDFQDRIESWKRANSRNNQVKFHLKRQADQIAGSTVSSPLKVRDFPPVGSMFYGGARLLRDSEACIHPVRTNNDSRRIVEAYPALVVNRCVGVRKYKDATGDRRIRARDTRADILNALGQPNIYGVTVGFAADGLRDACITDQTGDKLDSVLCAVQGAWSVDNQYGVPIFPFNHLSEIVKVEGWIADPELFRHFK